MRLNSLFRSFNQLSLIIPIVGIIVSSIIKSFVFNFRLDYLQFWFCLPMIAVAGILASDFVSGRGSLTSCFDYICLHIFYELLLLLFEFVLLHLSFFDLKLAFNLLKILLLFLFLQALSFFSCSLLCLFLLPFLFPKFLLLLSLLPFGSPTFLTNLF